MNEEQKKQPTEEGEKVVISHNVILIDDFNKALVKFRDFLKLSHSNPINNSDDLDNISRIYDLALEVYSNHLDIEILLLNAAIQKEEIGFLKEKLRQSECLVRYAIEYQKGIKVNIANDLAYSYNEKYEN